MDDNGNANDPNYVVEEEDVVLEVPDPTPGPSKPYSKVRLPPGAGAVFKEFETVEGIHDAVTGKEKEGSRCKHCSKVLYTKGKGNLETHLKMKHPQVATKVEGKNKCFLCRAIRHLVISYLFRLR